MPDILDELQSILDNEDLPSSVRSAAALEIQKLKEATEAEEEEEEAEAEEEA